MAKTSLRPGRFARIYGGLGFKKGYNFILSHLCFVDSGAMVGFALARFMYLHVPTLKEGVAPGEWYYLRTSLYKPAILIHLATVLPASILAVLQFVPAIRYRALIVHRICGYIAVFLLIMGVATGFVLGRRSFGGDISIQTGVVFLGAATLVSVALAYWNIKLLQIDQHRKWMLRTWFYASSIITLRILMIITAQVVSAIGQYHVAWSCEEVAFVVDDQAKMATDYPTCVNGQEGGFVVIPARWTNGVSIGSALRMTFGPALWMALFLHAVGVEIYIHLTPGENARLRKVSYERQLKRGFKHPGSRGTTNDHLGDNFGVQYKPE
ncbi:hypothetical protein BDV93DRAFT_591016 [Ceratobasidium sp. AG-I]|nr:hypothetical protein BDV93DRAFT_591016 [Ceratobasidium sp. AG-I]